MTTRQQRRAKEREDVRYWQRMRSELAQTDRKARLAAKRRQKAIAEEHRTVTEELQDALVDAVIADITKEA